MIGSRSFSRALAARGHRRSAALLCVVALSACRSPSPAAQPPARDSDGRVTFIYAPPPGAPPVTSIAVRGTFNDWSEHAHPMLRDPDGRWRATVELAPGSYEYKFFIGGAWPPDMCDDPVWGDPRHARWIDPRADGCVPDGNQGRNALLVVGPPDPPTGLGFRHDPARVEQLSLAGDRLSVRFSANAGQVREATVTAGGASHRMHRQLIFGHEEVWRASLPTGTTSYGLALETLSGPREFGPYDVPADPFHDVPWVGQSIGYQIFPERFWNGDRSNDSLGIVTNAWRYLHSDHWPATHPPALMPEWGGAVMEHHCCHQYWGGDLQGILDRLDDLQSLGVTLLYLNPVFVAGSAHGYDGHDFLRVSAGFGGEAMLRRLLDEAHTRGMRVMWDFVPNHVGVGHAAFQDAVANGDSSRFWSWFRFRVPAGELEVGNAAHYGAWSNVGTLPELETRHPDVLRHLLDVTRRWTEFGFDGIRVDVPSELRNRREFFPAFRRTAKAVKPDVYLVGEIWGRSPAWLRGDEFDALMNYAIGRDVIQRFATGQLAAEAAAVEMARLYAEYPEASSSMLFNVIATHDTPRLLTSMGGGELGHIADAPSKARQRLASAMLYALPGVPVTFQGDECALLGGGPPREENRYPVQWDKCDLGMRDHYVLLARFRRELEALRSPVIRMVAGTSTLLSFHRGEPGAGEVLAVFNPGIDARSMAIPTGTWVDAASGDRLTSEVTVPPYGWRYLIGGR